jgi:tryptophan synthase alpha chain
MCYANPIYVRGLERFADALLEAGASGLIVPDLPLDESDEVFRACDERGLALVPLVAPTTPDDRMARIGARARGFVYAVSVTGTTGERANLDGALGGILTRAKAATTVPVAVGFGIGNGRQAADAVDAGADGVIVGTRLVRAAAEGADPVAAVAEVLEELAGGLRS